MSADALDTLPADPAPQQASPQRRDSFWAGVRTVVRLELRQRVRSSRWPIVLAVWTAMLLVLTVAIRWSIYRGYGVGTATGADAAVAQVSAARTVFGIIVLLVLSLGALVAPALSSTSINGDRAAGVLATLQTTLITPVQLVVGKLAAAWLVALALLGCALPFILWAYAAGGTPIGRLLVVLVVLALVLLVICAIALGWSSLTARTSSSTLLTYLSVAFLGLGLPLLFALSIPLASQREVVTIRQVEYNGDELRCVTRQETINNFHSERTWWLLAASPYVVLADAAPTPGDIGSFDPLTGIRTGVREARLGGERDIDYCGTDLRDQQSAFEAREAIRAADRERLGVTWPFGLAADLALGGLFAGIAVRRLRTPTRSLPRGTRVA